MTKNPAKSIKRKGKARGGRPRKGRTGLPQVNMIDAIAYTKKAFESVGTTLKSFSGMADAMGLAKGFAKKAFGELKGYGLLKQEEMGWRVTDLGKRAVKGDKSAVMEILVKNDIMQDLFNNFKDKKVSTDYLEDYIKKKRYRYNINAVLVAERFLGAMEYIKNLETTDEPRIGTKIKADTDIFRSIRIIGSFLPIEDVKDKRTAVETLYKLAKNNNWERLMWLLEGLKNQSENAINDSSQKIVEAFEQDSGIKISGSDAKGKKKENKKT